MIPKIIHYCWFGCSPIPKSASALIEEWKRRLPDYRFIRWDESNFDVNCNAYVKEAYRMRSFAHVSDVCRIHALYETGGIYLDTDVEVVGSFDPYLHLKSFVSYEYDLIGTGVIGAEKGVPWLAKWLHDYDHRHFVNIWGHPVRTPNTVMLTNAILPSIDSSLHPAILPMEVFCGVKADDGTMTATDRSVTIHHFHASWRGKRTLRSRLETIVNGLRARYL